MNSVLLTSEYQKYTLNNRFGGGNYLTPSREKEISKWVLENPTHKQVEEILSRSQDYEPLGPVDPWIIPDNYGATPEEKEERAEKLYKFEHDAMVAVDLGLRYRLNLMGESENKSDLSGAVVRILDAWSHIQEIDNTTGGSVLNWNEIWGVYIQAALLVRDSPEYTSDIDINFKNATKRFLDKLSCAYTHFNNWASWGISTLIASAGLLEDRKMFNSAVYRWRDQFNKSIVSNYEVNNGGVAQGQIKHNIPKYEIYRQGSIQGNGSSGLNYSTHDLNGKVSAAEWARINGVWLYDHVSPDGSSLKGLYHNLANWTYNGRGPDGIENREVLWFNTSEPPTGFTFTARPSWSNILTQLWPDSNADRVAAKRLGDDTQGQRATALIYNGRPLMD